jgi:hypothetical protein
MIERMFSFDPAAFGPALVRDGYVHIAGGLTDRYRSLVTAQVDRYIHEKRLEHLRVGDKVQALYEFPSDDTGNQEPYLRQFFEGVGQIAGVDPARLVLSERHIKTYEPGADPLPLAHKDRFPTKLSVGFAVKVPPGSTLVLYPQGDLANNPFNSSTEYRRSFTPDRTPETRLAGVTPVQIQDHPGDVVVFYGSRIWHLRRYGADTVMLYFKLNDFNSDPLNEDPYTGRVAAATRERAELCDEALSALYPMVGRGVESFRQHIDREWNEYPGVVVAGTGFISLDRDEVPLLKRADGQRRVADLAGASGNGTSLESVRRLARCGALDLFEKPGGVVA